MMKEKMIKENKELGSHEKKGGETLKRKKK